MQTPIKTQEIYRSWILIVLWVLQVLVEAAMIFIYAVVIANLNAYLSTSLPSTSYSYFSSTDYKEVQATQALVHAAVVAASVILSISIAFLLLHIIQITLYARNRLTPSRHFSFEISRFVIWTVIFGIAIAAVVRTKAVNSAATVVVTVLIWILYLLSMVYASIVLHRYRKGDLNRHGLSYRNRRAQLSAPEETQAIHMAETV